MTFDDDDVFGAEIENMESTRGLRPPETSEGSPPLADEDRRFGPAEHDQHQQGGPLKSKLSGHEGSSSIAPGVDQLREDVTTSAGPSASSGSTASPESTVFVPLTRPSVRFVNDATSDYDDNSEDVQVSVYPREVLDEAKRRYARFFEKSRGRHGGAH